MELEDEPERGANPFVEGEAEVSGAESADEDDGAGVVPPGWRKKKRAEDKKKKARALRAPDGPDRSPGEGKASDERKKKPRKPSGKSKPRRIVDDDEEDEEGLVQAIKNSSLQPPPPGRGAEPYRHSNAEIRDGVWKERADTARGIEQMTEEELMGVDLDEELAIEAQMHAEHEARQRQTEADAARREAAEKKEARLRKMRERNEAQPTDPEGGFSGINRCVTCGVDIGDCNGRPLCGKTQCSNEFQAELSSDEEEDDETGEEEEPRGSMDDLD